MANQWGDGELRYVEVAATADGQNVIVAAAAGKRVKVIGFVLTVTAAAQQLVIESTGGTNLAQFTLAANGGVSYAGSYEGPAFQTIMDQGLAIVNPTGVDTYGFFTYLILDR
jgi:hypothetical protein